MKSAVVNVDGIFHDLLYNKKCSQEQLDINFSISKIFYFVIINNECLVFCKTFSGFFKAASASLPHSVFEDLRINKRNSTFHNYWEIWCFILTPLHHRKKKFSSKILKYGLCLYMWKNIET